MRILSLHRNARSQRLEIAHFVRGAGQGGCSLPLAGVSEPEKLLPVSEPPGYCAYRAKGREGWDVGSNGLAGMCWSGFGVDVLCVSLCVLACHAPC